MISTVFQVLYIVYTSVVVVKGNGGTPGVEISARMNAYDDGVITCDVANMPSNAVIEFLKISSGEAHVIERGGRYSITNGIPRYDGTTRFRLYISEFTTDDEGNYGCKIPASSSSSQDVAYGEVFLKYTAEPEIQYFRQEYVLDEGQDFTLPCIADGVPDPTITWSKEGDDSVQINDQNLHFPSIARTDSGTYVCTADNGVGYSPRRKTKLNVKFFPTKITANNTTIEGNPGSTVYLKCSVDGVPLSGVTLYKLTDQGRQRIVFDYNKYTVESKYADGLIKKYTFSIANLDQSDSGTYVLEASNYLGEDEVRFTVIVL